MHRAYRRWRARRELRLLERALDQLDARTTGRDLTPAEEDAYRKASHYRVVLVRELRAHGG